MPRFSLQAFGILLILVGVCIVANQAMAVAESEAVDSLPTSSPVVLAEQGRAVLPITISPQASEEMRKNAAELAGFLKQMSGADFAIEESAEAKGITLGTLVQFPADSLDEALAIRETYDGIEAFAIRTDKDRIRLIGNTDLGVTHAVYRMLESMGCRWFFPGDVWTIIPRTPSLAFRQNINSRPDYWSRKFMVGRSAETESGEAPLREVLVPWIRANAATDSLKIQANHVWHAIPESFGKGVFKADFEAHPEYFALVKGKRKPPQFCVTNKGLQAIVVAYAKKYLEDNPEADMVPFDTADQAGWCTCPDCSKLGNPSNQAFYLANIVGQGIQDSHPGKFVGILAYSWHSTPPDFAIEPNVFVVLTAGFNVGEFTFDELLDRWSKKCENLGIYEYFSVWNGHKGVFPGGRAANVDDFGRRLKLYQAHNVKGLVPEALSDWGLHGLGHYVAEKVMWDVSADIQAIKNDFYDKAFGPAAGPMERYFERVNANSNPLPGKALLLLCAEDLEEASALAKGDPKIMARITALKEFLVYNFLVLKIQMSGPLGTGQPDQGVAKKKESAETLAIQKQLTVDMLEWVYRTRNNQMTQWTMIRSGVGRPASERYQDPAMFWRNKDVKHLWRNEEPVTPAELEAKLEGMKAEFGPVPEMAVKDFSDRLVLVRSDQPGDEKERSGMFMNSNTGASTCYALASLKGEPLRITVSKKANQSLVRPDVRYRLESADGKEIAAGTFDAAEQILELKVPGPGVYWFTGKARDAWNLTFAQDVPSALIMRRGERHMVTNLDGPLYFYVPKGSKAFSFYPGQYGIRQINNPAGELVFEEVADGGYVNIPVPEGMDGKVWSLGDATIRLNYLWFFNVPTLLSSSPDLVFVPEEVAKADGLEVVLP